jgi:hypothetical protein
MLVLLKILRYTLVSYSSSITFFFVAASSQLCKDNILLKNNWLRTFHSLLFKP